MEDTKEETPTPPIDPKLEEILTKLEEILTKVKKEKSKNSRNRLIS